ncbi:MAG: ATP-binding protein [Bacteroidales bacterium]|nr:ATP-binding protein [Bacteroidales bacterium]
MRAPFTFGKIASFDDFANREEETNRLVTNFTSQINTILISPRRWGKSSLVNYAAYKAFKANKNIRFVFLDLYNVRSEEEFYNLLAKEVLRASFTKTEELVEKARKFLGQLLPQISIGVDPETDFTLSFNWKLAKKDPSDILNLSENIAKEKNIKFVICIDEFQNIANFGDSLAIQKKLRSNWQKHKNTTYCLYGSKRHMLIDVFTSVSMPFYKFGDILFLQKIARPALQKFIIKRFKDTGKTIDKKDAEIIVNLVECHPYYAQQLAQLVWLRTSKVCSPEIVEEAHWGLVMQLDFLFQTITDTLSNTQVNFLKAVIENVEEYSSKETIKTYNLGTSANVNRIKTSLENKEIIDISGNKISLLDPLYKFWLAKVYFKI